MHFGICLPLHFTAHGYWGRMNKITKPSSVCRSQLYDFRKRFSRKMCSKLSCDWL